MIFSKLYSSYYNTVARILKAAVHHPLTKDEIREIIQQNSFSESFINIESALKEERWQLMHQDGSTPIKNEPSMPLTLLQKRWLKAISMDPRMKLFTDDFPELSDVKPLFSPEDYSIFDQYSDGDPYEDETYIHHFRLILDALRNQKPLHVKIQNRRHRLTRFTVLPQCLEYSEKDDKFRLIAADKRKTYTINLGRMVSCKLLDDNLHIHQKSFYQPKQKSVEFELLNYRNALERVLLHFAHFEKEAEKLDEKKYLVRINYDESDETEILIRILSFGPMLKVTSSQNFIELMKERLMQQKSCEQ